ncbi:MAG: universal stress protein [Myxococcales bacterium]|nr:universal stress protein [Myxococcales bacterium]
MKILVGVDGSTREPKVLDEAIALAKSRGGKLHLARAMMVPVSIPTAVWTLQGEDFSQFLVEHGDKELALTAERIPPELLGGLVTRLGQPADVLVSLADELDVDLVIIGSHGYGGIDRVLGTTAAKVVNRAPCSVMVVR